MRLVMIPSSSLITPLLRFGGRLLSKGLPCESYTAAVKKAYFAVFIILLPHEKNNLPYIRSIDLRGNKAVRVDDYSKSSCLRKSVTAIEPKTVQRRVYAYHARVPVDLKEFNRCHRRARLTITHIQVMEVQGYSIWSMHGAPETE